MVIPIGKIPEQSLRLIKKGPQGEQVSRDILPVQFVPLRRAHDEKSK